MTQIHKGHSTSSVRLWPEVQSPSSITFGFGVTDIENTKIWTNDSDSGH
ncbi:MAG: hypothetical protein IPN10_08610 [Saprospiraceae bacterium]|nr:hypothetical protein [Saprospiraceae bacterium]